jgi:GT2 family glycosyltransferase
MRVDASKSDADYYLWLDTDIIYQPEAFPYMLNSIPYIKEQGIDKFVITPEIVRIWDDTWDCLVNENFINKNVGYEKINNPYEDAKIYGDINIEEVVCNVPGQPYMKFAGGWFTIISKSLLNELPWPENYGHYGYDDTYLMWAASVKNDRTIRQFKLKNLVVCENYFDRITSYEGLVELIDRREEYKKYNLEKAIQALEKLKY